MVGKARTEALFVVDEAEKAVAILRNFAGENDADVTQALSDHGRMKEPPGEAGSLLQL